MTPIRCLEFLLFLLLHETHSQTPEPRFRVLGSNIELGYCFGVDYIVVYRSGPEGNELLGNSSASAPITPPVDLRGRIQVNHHESLLGLQIRKLTHMDSGTYRKECWTNLTLVSQLTQQLFVCNEEVESKEIIMKEGAKTTQLLCNSSSTRLEGTSVRWYFEMYPHYKTTLFLDTTVSLKPLELQSVVEVKDKGALLVLDNSMLEINHHFYCLVIKGDNCLSLQNMYTQDYSESWDIYASPGDTVVLNCPSYGHDQHWETPLGYMNDTSKMKNQMYISSKDKNFSLVIPSASDEFAGEYSCISSSFEMHYLLVFCPRKTALPSQKFVSEGEDVVLDCDTDQDDHTVQWYRQQTSMEYELIYDSNKITFLSPKDLRERLTKPKSGYSLRISNLKMKDSGSYFCVVFEGTKFSFYEYDDIITDYDEEYLVESWNNSHKCILKQETFLIISNSRAQPFPIPTAHVPTRVIACTVIGLVVLVVAIAVVIVLKQTGKLNCTGTPSPSRQELNLKRDPSCTKKLTKGEQGVV
ncbi:hypothetical protein EXN66_Car004718 [Channa argus]|uniref:Ig-like domain-containing protein n=1 Tax=Channa argus TaxID=215402 RepID=A0A6G1PG94_CHAAH|nr:hypothetical protein EXN66_Car004718 [Channa argus]